MIRMEAAVYLISPRAVDELLALVGDCPDTRTREDATLILRREVLRVSQTAVLDDTMLVAGSDTQGVDLEYHHRRRIREGLARSISESEAVIDRSWEAV